MVRKRQGLHGLATPAVLGLALALAACGGRDTYQAAPTPDRDPSAAQAGVLSPGGVGANLFTGDVSKGGSEGAIAVNAFLWRASLDTIAFMPLASADPFGGVIITDWYAPPETPDERFKVNVYILGRQLRADGVKVSVFRQQQDAAGRWNDAAVGPEVSAEFENAVLSQARELRLRAAAAN
jgi:hypothetical protein